MFTGDAKPFVLLLVLAASSLQHGTAQGLCGSVCYEDATRSKPCEPSLCGPCRFRASDGFVYCTRALVPGLCSQNRFYCAPPLAPTSSPPDSPSPSSSPPAPSPAPAPPTDEPTSTPSPPPPAPPPPPPSPAPTPSSGAKPPPAPSNPGTLAPTTPNAATSSPTSGDSPTLPSNTTSQTEIPTRSDSPTSSSSSSDAAGTSVPAATDQSRADFKTSIWQNPLFTGGIAVGVFGLVCISFFIFYIMKRRRRLAEQEAAAAAPVEGPKSGRTKSTTLPRRPLDSKGNYEAMQTGRSEYSNGRSSYDLRNEFEL